MMPGKIPIALLYDTNTVIIETTFRKFQLFKKKMHCRTLNLISYYVILSKGDNVTFRELRRQLYKIESRERMKIKNSSRNIL